MSVENLKEYARRCASDPDLRAVAKTIGMSDLEEHIRHAGSLGLDWTRADLVAFRKEVIGDGEVDDLVDLTEEELEQVAGGVFVVTLVVAGVVGAAAGAVVTTAAVVGGVAGTAAATGGGGW